MSDIYRHACEVTVPDRLSAGHGSRCGVRDLRPAPYPRQEAAPRGSPFHCAGQSSADLWAGQSGQSGPAWPGVGPARSACIGSPAGRPARSGEVRRSSGSEAAPRACTDTVRASLLAQ